MNWPSLLIGIGAGIALSGCAALAAAFLFRRELHIAPAIDKIEPRQWPDDGSGAGATTLDVVAVSVPGSRVLWSYAVAGKKNADAALSMAIARQGVDDRFFTITPHGKYNAGDVFNGDGMPDAAPEVDGITC